MHSALSGGNKSIIEESDALNLISFFFWFILRVLQKMLLVKTKLKLLLSQSRTTAVRGNWSEYFFFVKLELE